MQISIQSPDAEENDRIAGNRSFEQKIAAARVAKELDFPLTINCVLHRQNLDRIEELLDLALDLGAQRLELANTQYYGWAIANQEALMPSPEQLRRGEEAVQRFRERVGPKVHVLWVLPDFYEELPKPCMGGWGRTAMVVTPNGDVLPCQAASTIPGLEFANVREHPLEWIWSESDAFARFRGTDWMQEPCRTCPLGRQEVDWGGCRCQALRLTGDAARRGSGLPLLGRSRSRRRKHASRHGRTSSSIARRSGPRASELLQGRLVSPAVASSARPGRGYRLVCWRHG